MEKEGEQRKNIFILFFFKKGDFGEFTKEGFTFLGKFWQ